MSFMKIRYCIVVVILPLISITPAFSQEDSTVVRQEFSKMFDEVDKGNYAYLFDKIYPKFYEIIPRELLEKAMMDALHSEDVELKLYDSKIDDVIFLENLDGIAYYKVEYSNKMSMKYLNLQEDKDSSFDMNALLLAALGKEFGADNVSFNETENKYEVKAVKSSLAILDPEYEGWKVINIEKAYRPVLIKILPETILNHF